MNGLKKCRGCGREIRWMRTTAGHAMPVDAEPVWIRLESGGDTFVRRDGAIVFGKKIGDAYDDDDPDTNLLEVYESHFATCPAGGQFRNRKPRTRAPGFR